MERGRDSIMRQMDPRTLSLLALCVLCGLLWAVAVYTDLPNYVRVPCVIAMVALGFIAGNRNRE